MTTIKPRTNTRATRKSATTPDSNKETAMASRTGSKPTTKTTAKKTRKKREKVEKVPHPLTQSTDEDVYPFHYNEAEDNVTFPEDYNPRIHNKIGVDDFATKGDYYEWRAALAEKSVAKYKKQAKEFRLYGDAEQRKAVNKLQKMRASMAALEASLSDMGVDLDDLIDEDEE